MTASTKLVLVEDDGDGGCSWCRVITEEGKEDEKTSLNFWAKGEELRKSKNRAEALVFYNRGVVANPQNSACWSSIAKVQLELGNHRKSEEAARRARNTTP